MKEPRLSISFFFYYFEIRERGSLQWIKMHLIRLKGVKTFFGVGSLNHAGTNPEEGLIQQIRTFIRHGSPALWSAGRGQWDTRNKNKLCSLTCGGCFTRILRRDPTLRKILTPCQDLSDIDADFAYKTFLGVGSLDIWGSNPEESLDTCQT